MFRHYFHIQPVVFKEMQECSGGGGGDGAEEPPDFRERSDHRPATAAGNNLL